MTVILADKYKTSIKMEVKLQTVLICGLMTSIFGWRPFTVKFLNETHEIRQPDVLDVNLTIKNQSCVDAYLNLAQDVSQLFLDLEVMFDSGDGNYSMVYMNKTIDLCLFLNNRKTNPLLDISYRILTAYGDLPKRCPMRKGSYKLLNVFMDPEKFPPFMPNHKARATGVTWNKLNGKKNILMVLRVHVAIERSFKNDGN